MKSKRTKHERERGKTVDKGGRHELDEWEGEIRGKIKCRMMGKENMFEKIENRNKVWSLIACIISKSQILFKYIL